MHNAYVRYAGKPCIIQESATELDDLQRAWMISMKSGGSTQHATIVIEFSGNRASGRDRLQESAAAFHGEPLDAMEVIGVDAVRIPIPGAHTGRTSSIERVITLVGRPADQGFRHGGHHEATRA